MIAKTLAQHEAEVEAEYVTNSGLQCRCPDRSGSCDYCQSQKDLLSCDDEVHVTVGRNRSCECGKVQSS